jgi:response regulator RpfG family c-di-GMP phosphodiesterase
MKLAVLLYSDAPNPLGFPAQYPSEVRQVDDSVTIESPWVEMTQDQIDSLHEQYMEQVQEIARLNESVPQEVLLYQFRTAVTMAGLKSAIEALIESLPDPTKTVVHEKWEYGNTVKRYHPQTIQLATAMGISSAQIDDIFRTAATIQ